MRKGRGGEDDPLSRPPPAPERQMRHLDLFSGIGGFALAARNMDWPTIGFCEIDEFCVGILRRRFASYRGFSLPGSVDRGEASGTDGLAELSLIGLLSRTSTTPGADGCPSCGAACTSEGIPACRFECQPLALEESIIAPAGGWLPTPTASSYGSCRGGGAGRLGPWRPSLQSLGILHPEDWERMMGYRIGHTGAEL